MGPRNGIGQEIGGAFRLLDRVLCGDKPMNLSDLDRDIDAPSPAAPANDPNTITVAADGACATCNGARVLGAPGHQIACPVCAPRKELAR
jgi:hypothetical protein